MAAYKPAASPSKSVSVRCERQPLIRPSEPATMASQAVFHTSEPIEAILAELPSFEVTTAMHVCFAWRAVVLKSTALPTAKPISPLMAADLPAFVRDDMLYPPRTKLELHPALPRRLRDLWLDYDLEMADFDTGRELRVHFQKHRSAFLKFRDRRLLRRLVGAEQFATLPPVKYMLVENSIRDVEREKDVEKVICAVGGVRLRDLEAVVRKVQRCGGRRIRMGVRVQQL